MPKGDNLARLHKNPEFQKKRLAGLKKYWAKKRKESKKSKKRGPYKKRIEKTILASNRTVRLIIYGNNPNTGATELLENSLVSSMQDSLGTIIDYLYNGTVLTEVRLQNYE